MFRGNLVPGDRVKVFTWFGTVLFNVVLDKKKLIITTDNGDVSMPVEKLAFRSKVHSPTSRWVYTGKNKDHVEYTDYEEVEEEKIETIPPVPIIDLRKTCDLHYYGRTT